MSRLRLDSVARNLARRLPRRAALFQLTAGAAAGLLAATGRAVAQEATPSPEGSAFVVARRYQLKPGNSMTELTTLVHDGFVPIVSTIPGFREYFLADSGEGAHFSVSVFDDEAGAEASTREAADWAAATVAPLIEGPPEVTEGWVRVHITAADTEETV